MPISGDALYVSTFGGFYHLKVTVDDDYFTTAYIGTNDTRYGQVINQMVEMLGRKMFKDNFVYCQVKNAFHDMNATDEWIAVIFQITVRTDIFHCFINYNTYFIHFNKI